MYQLKKPSDLIPGYLSIPENASGLVILCPGIEDVRSSPQVHFIAQHFQRRGLATFLCDIHSKQLNQNSGTSLYAEPSELLVKTTRALTNLPDLKGLPVGYFTSDTATSVALSAASALQGKVDAIVSCNGISGQDLDELFGLEIPVLFMVGERAPHILSLNRRTLHCLGGSANLAVIIKGALKLFDSDVRLQQVAELSGNWFHSHLSGKSDVPDQKYAMASSF